MAAVPPLPDRVAPAPARGPAAQGMPGPGPGAEGKEFIKRFESTVRAAPAGGRDRL